MIGSSASSCSRSSPTTPPAAEAYPPDPIQLALGILSGQIAAGTADAGSPTRHALEPRASAKAPAVAAL